VSYTDLFYEYDLITTLKPGWNLSEVRALTNHERKFWVNVAKSRTSRG
jgi:hypothetical protein